MILQSFRTCFDFLGLEQRMLSLVVINKLLGAIFLYMLIRCLIQLIITDKTNYLDVVSCKNSFYFLRGKMELMLLVDLSYLCCSQELTFLP